MSDSVQSLKQFTTELVVEGIALCVKALNGALDIPTRLPPSMTARFKVGTALAQAVQVYNKQFRNILEKYIDW